MTATDFHLAAAFVLLVVTIPLLGLLARLLSAPWRTLAARYPGSGERYSLQVSYVMSRLYGKPLPFSLTRCIRLRAAHEHLALTVLGFDFPPARLSEIRIPREAILQCVPCDRLLTRQKIVVADGVTIVVYGRGAKFVRNWWIDRSQ